MTTYVYDKKLEKMVMKDGDNFASTHYIISDTQPLLKHPITGKHYDSKSRFRADTKASGCEEVGNERMETRKAPIDREHRRQVLRQNLERNGITDSKASEIMNSLARQARR